VVSATNRNIDALLESGAFRSDLYHRIADWVVELPALRSRREDIPNLAVHFLSSACDEAGVAPAGISKAALNVLTAASWPGNIRQLEREMSRVALFLEDGDLLDTSLLPDSLFDGAESQGGDASLKCILEDAERSAIESALAAAAGDVPMAAESLEIGRSTLYRRMTALGIGE
jgi:DNA-binding NtrC family response regulator